MTTPSGVSDLHDGIAAVSAGLEDGGRRVLEGRCPHLLPEAGMYRWGESEDRRAETPADEHNHALAALRYLVATIDRRRLGRRRVEVEAEESGKTVEEIAAAEKARRYWERAISEDDGMWWRLG